MNTPKLTPEKNPFKKGDTVIHPQHGERKVIHIVTDAQTPAVVLKDLLGAIPTHILKKKVTVQKPKA